MSTALRPSAGDKKTFIPRILIEINFFIKDQGARLLTMDTKLSTDNENSIWEFSTPICKAYICLPTSLVEFHFELDPHYWTTRNIIGELSSNLTLLFDIGIHDITCDITLEFTILHGCNNSFC